MDNLILTSVFIITPIVFVVSVTNLFFFKNKEDLEKSREIIKGNETKIFLTLSIFISVALLYLVAFVTVFVGFDVKVHAFIITCIILISAVLLFSLEYRINRLINRYKSFSKFLLSSIYVGFLAVITVFVNQEIGRFAEINPEYFTYGSIVVAFFIAPIILAYLISIIFIGMIILHASFLGVKYLFLNLGALKNTGESILYVFGKDNNKSGTDNYFTHIAIFLGLFLPSVLLPSYATWFHTDSDIRNFMIKSFVFSSFSLDGDKCKGFSESYKGFDVSVAHLYKRRVLIAYKKNNEYVFKEDECVPIHSVDKKMNCKNRVR